MSSKKNLNKKVESRFDSEVEKWEKYHDNKISTIIDWEVHKRKLIVKNHLKNKYGGKSINILEIGCGAGNNLDEILKLDSNWKGLGVDISSKMIDYCKNKYKTNNKVDFEVLNLENQILKDKYDVIILLGVVGYFKNNSKVFNNISKMLENNGELIFTYGNKSSLFRKIRIIYLSWTKFKLVRVPLNFLRKSLLNKKRLCANSNNSYFKLYSQKEINYALNTASLTPIFKYNIGFSSGFLGKFSLFSAKKLERIMSKKDVFNLSITKLIICKNGKK